MPLPWMFCAALALSVVACDVPGCTPTEMTATEASIVVAPDAARSGVLSATLTADGKALSGKQVEFSVDQAVVGSPTLGRETTDARGRARLDLKGRPLSLVKTVTEDDYTAAFGGDGTYCSSSDAAPLTIAHLR